MKPQAELLDHWHSWDTRDAAFHATHRARGLYSTFQFVLRLSPEVHRQLERQPSGIHSGPLDFDIKQAFSILLHETIHWWQHIGSSYGLMLSLSYPAQTQANYGHLKRLVAQIGFKKPIRHYIEQVDGPSKIDTPIGIANIIVNNHFDIEAFRSLSVVPRAAERIVRDPLFQCIGHAYQIAFTNNVVLLAASGDPDYKVLQHPRLWESGFRQASSDRIEGFYHGSPLKLSPIGAYAIFEGQARFAQLQYLHFATGGQFELTHAVEWGMLTGIYGEAFTAFLQLSGIDQPTSINHPVVALFLLVCDMAINPSAGFPGPIIHHSTFVHDIDPGMRFMFLCRTILKKCQHLAHAVRNYSRAEYETISTELASALLLDPPLDVLRNICNWRGGSDGIRQLMMSYESFDFDPINTLPRVVLLAHFIAFAEDKHRQPEFFCWPGAWMAGDRVSKQAEVLFERHGALFVDKPDDDGIFPRLRAGLELSAIQSTFETFYSAVVLYDLTHQWIALPGPFQYKLRWLSQRGTDTEIKAFADSRFSSAYGVHPDSVELIT